MVSGELAAVFRFFLLLLTVVVGCYYFLLKNTSYVMRPTVYYFLNLKIIIESLSVPSFLLNGITYFSLELLEHLLWPYCHYVREVIFILSFFFKDHVHVLPSWLEAAQEILSDVHRRGRASDKHWRPTKGGITLRWLHYTDFIII